MTYCGTLTILYTQTVRRVCVPSHGNMPVRINPGNASDVKVLTFLWYVQVPQRICVPSIKGTSIS